MYEVFTRKLNNGQDMPTIGMGTFGSDKYSGAEIADAVYGAIKIGYRLFDCASVYGNEDVIGEVFQKALDEKLVKREELFIVSKVWNDKHGAGDVLLSCAQTLKDLQLDYLDMYIVHWPFPNYHAPGCDGDARNPDSRPFITEEFMACWKQMERLVDMGLVKGIGVSNMTIPKLEAVLPLCRIKPALNEMELHPAFQQPELFQYCLDKGIQPIGFCPIGSPSRPERDKTPEDVSPTEMPAIVEAAKAHNIHPAVVCLKWSIQQGAIPIPFSVKPTSYESNLRCVSEEPLTKEEMDKINSIDHKCRLIKGQVFLWEGASDWRVLWDEDGKIADWNS